MPIWKVPRGAGGGGGGGVSGTGVNNRLTIWNGTSSLTSDPGLARESTGTSLELKVGDEFQGIIRDRTGVIGVVGNHGTYGRVTSGVVEAKGPAPNATPPSLTIHQTSTADITTILVGTRSVGTIEIVNTLATQATGRIDLPDSAAEILDGETLTVTDASGVIVYEFDTNAAWNPANTRVDISGCLTGIDVVAVLAPLIDANNTDVVVTGIGTQKIDLVASTYGAAGAIILATSVADPDFVVSVTAPFAGIEDGDDVTINDNINAPVTFSFDVDSQGGGAGITIPVSSATPGQGVVMAALLAAIQTEIGLGNLDFVATSNGGGGPTYVITLTHTSYANNDAALGTTVTIPGAIVVTGTAGGIDGINLGDTFQLDGIDTYEFSIDGSATLPANIPVDVAEAATADNVRDAIITAVMAAPVAYTAESGGAATVRLWYRTIDTPGGVNAEAVAFAGPPVFAISAFAYRTKASDYTARMLYKMDDGSYVVSDAAELSLAGLNPAPNVLDIHDYVEIVWVFPSDVYVADLYRTVWTGGDTTTGIILPDTQATGVNDTGIVAGLQVFPHVPYRTTRVVIGSSTLNTTNYVRHVEVDLSTVGAASDVFYFVGAQSSGNTLMFAADFTVTFEDDTVSYIFATGKVEGGFWWSVKDGSFYSGVSGNYTAHVAPAVTLTALTWAVNWNPIGDLFTVTVTPTLGGVAVGANPVFQMRLMPRIMCLGSGVIG